MELIYEICLDMPENLKNIISTTYFSAGDRIGENLLSACIAKEVSEKGFSVVYDTATQILAQFETQKFSKDSEEGRAAGEEVKRYLHCDLLIVDDLGSELTTPLCSLRFTR